MISESQVVDCMWEYNGNDMEDIPNKTCVFLHRFTEQKQFLWDIRKIYSFSNNFK